MRLHKELSSLSPSNVVAVLVASTAGGQMEGDSAGGLVRAHAGSPGLDEDHTYGLGIGAGAAEGAGAAAGASAAAAGDTEGTISKVTLLLSPRSKERRFWQSVRYVAEHHCCYAHPLTPAFCCVVGSPCRSCLCVCPPQQPPPRPVPPSLPASVEYCSCWMAWGCSTAPC